MVVSAPGDTADSVRRHAGALGFSHVGFAAANPLEHEESLLREWLTRGYHAGMQWMERDPQRRTDPGRVLDGARTVISLAMNYYTPQGHSEDASHGKISRYAWGDDYHDVIDGRLKELESWMHEAFPGAETRRYVDTGPVMDKAWAVRAGIGWLGKHSNVITRDTGSWVFLAEILTTLELPPDRPMADYCGTCTACIEACPTAAITEPYVVDASKCISYLTIEYRGEQLPREQSTKLENWVYGCDICQDVCPWNSFARGSTEAAFAPREQNVAPSLRELASITDEAFRDRFRRSAVKRAKAWGLRRNARTVLAHRESYTDR